MGRERDKIEKTHNTTQNPENCLPISSPAQRKKVTREWGDWSKGGGAVDPRLEKEQVEGRQAGDGHRGR